MNNHREALSGGPVKEIFKEENNKRSQGRTYKNGFSCLVELAAQCQT